MGLDQLTEIRVGNVMTRKVVTLMADDSIVDAANIMTEHGISAVPIVDAKEKCIGILSRSDLTELLINEDDQLSRLLDTERLSLEWFHQSLETCEGRSVAEVMEDRVATINENQNIQHASREFVRNRIHHLPVIDNSNRVVGIISTYDIVKAIAEID